MMRELLNRRGRARDALFEELEREHLLLPERLMFDACMKRDREQSLYYLPTRGDYWPSGFIIPLIGTFEQWCWLKEHAFITLDRFQETKIYRFQISQRGEVSFGLMDRGKEYVIDKTLLLNRRLCEATGNTQELEMLNVAGTEQQILGLDAMARYIRIE